MRNNVQKLKKTNYLGFRDMLLRPARAKHAINTGRLKFDFVEATLKKGTTQIVLDSNDIDDDGFCKYRKDTIKLNIYQISYRESEVTVEITIGLREASGQKYWSRTKHSTVYKPST